MYFQHQLIITVIITQSTAAFHSISWIESDLKLECCKNTNQLMGKKKEERLTSPFDTVQKLKK